MKARVCGEATMPPATTSHCARVIPRIAQIEVPREVGARDHLQRHAEPGRHLAQEFDVEAGPIGTAGD